MFSHSLSSIFRKQQSIYNPFPQSGSPTASPSAVPQYGMPVRFNPVIGFALAALFTICFFLGSLCIYVKRHLAARRRRAAALPVIAATVVGIPAPLLHQGLDKETIQSLPVVAFSPEIYSKEGKSPSECSVCLTEFRKDEPLKFLPSCSHLFHPECIDMWLFSHSTCPLCRNVLVSIKSWSEPVHESFSQPSTAPGEVAITIPDNEFPGDEQAVVSSPRRDQELLSLLSPVKEESVSKLSHNGVRTYLHRCSSSPLMAAERRGENPASECTTVGNDAGAESLTRSAGGLRRTTSIPALAFQSRPDGVEQRLFLMRALHQLQMTRIIILHFCIKY